MLFTSYILRGLSLMKGTINQVKAAMNGSEIKKIRLVSESGDVGTIVNQIREISKVPGIKFQFAEIRHELTKIPNDPSKDEFYPLTIYAQGGIRICVSEVRCGYHGASTDAMISILDIIGAKLDQHDKDEIYNNRSIKKRTFVISPEAKAY